MMSSARSFAPAAAAALAIALSCGAALAQTAFQELEPNDDKEGANGPLSMASGDFILGMTTGSSTTNPGPASADYFIVRTAPAAARVYRHRLVITTDGVAGHTGTIRGLTQSGGVVNFASDAVIQTSSATTVPSRYVQWYGFGKEEQIYFRVTGTSSTTGAYRATLETEEAPIIDLGSFYSGFITIDRPDGVTTDTDFWVYDSNFNAIPDYGNDNPNVLSRFYAPGTYYIGYTNFNFANDQPAASDETRLTGAVMDFANSAANSTTTLVPGLRIRLTDAFGPVDAAAAKSAPFEVVWLRFTVSDTPPESGACCLPDGACVQLREAACLGMGGVFSGAGVECAAVECPQPGACCLPGFVCEVLSAGQCAAAGGTYQGNGTACADCPSPPPGSVALLGADSASNVNDVLANLTGLNVFPYIATPNVMSATPSLEYLRQFGAVLVWSNQSFQSAEALGNVLADYVDSGGGVVVTMFTLGSTTNNRYLTGRWDSTYQIVPQQGGSTSTGGQQFLGNVLIPNHPIMEGVNTLAGGSSSYRPTTTALNSHGVKVAEWTDGKTLIAVSSTRPNRADVGMGAPSAAASSTYWDPATDGARILANALTYTMSTTPPCPADWNGDGSVNSSDLSAFITSWLNSVQNGNLIADFNNDGFVNSSDLSAFITAWLGAVQGGC